MFKDLIKFNNGKNKLITLVLSVICAVMFVFIGVKANSNLSSSSLFVNGDGNFLGDLNINFGINIPNSNSKKFLVDKDGNVSIGGSVIINSNKEWKGSLDGIQGIQGDPGEAGDPNLADYYDPILKQWFHVQGDPGPPGDPTLKTYNGVNVVGDPGPKGDTGPRGPSVGIWCKN